MGIMSAFRGYKAEAAVEAYRIIKAGSADMTCVKSVAATDALLGTADSLDKVTGEVVDVYVSPIGEVRLGGAVVRGAALTSDANGKAISTTTIGHRIIGFAEVSGVADDVITYIRDLGVL